MKATVKMRILWPTVTLVIAAAAAVAACNVAVTRNASGRVYSCVDSVPMRQVGLLLGTSPRSRLTGREGRFYAPRINAAVSLYRAGKVKRLLISGSDSSAFGINEVQSMRRSLLARGVPDSVITLDGKGYRTIASVRRATQVYGLSNYVVISQRFHNERAIYQADHISRLNAGRVIGFNAVDPKGVLAARIYVREWFARVKLMWEVWLQ